MLKHNLVYSILQQEGGTSKSVMTQDEAASSDIVMTDHSYTFEKDLQCMPDIDDMPERPRSKKLKEKSSLLHMQENSMKKTYEKRFMRVRDTWRI